MSLTIRSLDMLATPSPRLNPCAVVPLAAAAAIAIGWTALRLVPLSWVISERF
jgi:hypothetical protein